MKKLIKLLLEIFIIFIIIQSLFITKKYLVGIPILLIYLVYKLFKNKASILAFIGNIYFNKNNYKEALDYYDASSRSFKCDDSIKIRYAYISLYCGDLNKCKEILNLIPSNHLPEKLKSSYKITEALYTWKSGNIENAIEICKTIDENYTNTLVYETLGYLLLISERYEEALIYNRKAYEYDNSSNIIIDNLAQSYYYLGYYEKAQILYKSLLCNTDKDLSFSEPYYYYGLILNKLGDKNGCINYLKEALTKKESFLSDLTHQKISEVLSEL